MNIEDIHKILKLKDTALYNKFKYFINAANKDHTYKLFYFYLFRTDLMVDAIQNNNYPFFEKNEKYIVHHNINYRNKYVKRYVDDNMNLYIGNTYFSSYGFRPIFISYKISNDYDTPNKKYGYVSGFSINAGIGSDSVLFDKSTMKVVRELSDKELNYDIQIADGELTDHFAQMSERTREHLI